MEALLLILSSVILISCLSLIGILSLIISKKKLHSFLILFVAFASGSLLAASFIHLIPEAYHEIGGQTFTLVLAGIVVFFIFEKFIHWHHCGHEECTVRPVAYLNLVADGFHNFIDGIIITAAYLIDIQLGLVTTLAIALHEIPQEFGDFSVLIHSGMKSRKALAYNFLSASMAILGALTGYIFLSEVQYLIPYAIAFAAGGFIYIATADLMPELHKESAPGKMITQTIALVLGILVLSMAFNALPHEHHDKHENSDKHELEYDREIHLEDEQGEGGHDQEYDLGPNSD